MEVTLHTLGTGARRCGWSTPRVVRFTPGKKLIPI